MPSRIETDTNGYIELKFGPRWKYIATVRAFLQNFLAIGVSDASRADKIAMAASELLENAVKYSTRDDIVISVKIDPDEKITVAVENQGSEAGCVELQRVFDKIHEGTALECFLEQMREAATRTDGLSQLGFVRIRYEAESELKLDISDSYRVRVSFVNTGK